jgi:hypothetical protein
VAHDVYHRLDLSHLRIFLPSTRCNLKSQNLWYTIPIYKQDGVYVRWLGIFVISYLLLGWGPKSHTLTVLINDYRSEWNAKALLEDYRLSCAAKYHLDYILKARACTSVGPQGQTVRDRAITCGYPWTMGEQLLVCQYLTEDAWFNTLGVYPKEYRILRDHAWQKIGVAGDDLWWVIILAR